MVQLVDHQVHYNHVQLLNQLRHAQVIFHHQEFVILIVAVFVKQLQVVHN